MPAIIKTTKTKLSPWVDLVTKELVSPNVDGPQIYHSFAQADYANIVSVTRDGWVPLVRQYRTAIERYTLELPGGLCDLNEDPRCTAIRELTEETGYCVDEDPVPLGNFSPDPGRLENRMWGFFAHASIATSSATRDPPEVELVLVKKGDLVQLVLDGKIEHVGHTALILLSIWRGLL